MCDHHKPCLLLQHENPGDYMRNQSEFGPKMMGIRGILAFHFAQRSSALKAVKGSKKK